MENKVRKNSQAEQKRIKHTPKHIIITLSKIKDKEIILKAAGEKETVTYKGVPIRLSADFSEEILQARRGLGTSRKTLNVPTSKS